MRKAFTLIEIMVATILLAMLVTILTMIFNQSSIAWSTGVASVTALGNARTEMSVYAQKSENVIRGDDSNRLLVRSVWDSWNGTSRQWEAPADNSASLRPLQTWDKFKNETADVISEKFFEVGGLEDVTVGEYFNTGFTINGGAALERDSYLVGVHSYGPDGKTGGDYSWDDISTMPEEIVK